jgi:hypothetical protein
MDGWPVEPWQLLIYAIVVSLAFRTLTSLMAAHKARLLAERAARQAALQAEQDADFPIKKKKKSDSARKRAA